MNVHQPLFVSLFNLAIPNMEGYQSDLGHDVLMLAKAKIGDAFLWGYRKTGTFIIPLGDVEEGIFDMDGHKWFILHITDIRFGNQADGTIEPLEGTKEEMISTINVFKVGDPTRRRPLRGLSHEAENLWSRRNDL